MTDNGLAELTKAVECLLFASPEMLSSERLAEVLEAPLEAVTEALGALRASLDDRGLQLVQLAGGHQLATRPEYASCVQRLLQPPPARLSPQALETLAIVAYRQPITRPEIDAVRGVNSQHAVASLTEKGLVTTVGRRDAPGRPVLYATTPHFLSSFGLRDLAELPSLEQLRQSLTPEPTLVLRGVLTDEQPPGEGEEEGGEPEAGAGESPAPEPTAERPEGASPVEP